MKSHKIIFLEVEKEDEEKISKAFPDAKLFNKILSEDEIIKQCQEAEILIVFIYSQISQRVIENLPNLKLIVTRSVGYDHIDLKSTRKHGIEVCNVPDYGSHVIAEHVFALLLSGLRNVRESGNRVEKEYEFNFRGFRGTALKGKTLGIIGTGKIGKNVARIASLGFLMDVVAFDVNPNEEAARENHFSYVSLENIWKKSDIITLHCPLLEETKHLINNKSIVKMKEGVVLINTARGGVIDTEALVDALQSGKISHALLDVLEHEKNIRENKELLDIPGVTVTPHIAFYADDSMKKMYEESFFSINRFIKKEKLVHRVYGV
jgi:D-lactate dehydrogenase